MYQRTYPIPIHQDFNISQAFILGGFITNEEFSEYQNDFWDS